MIVPDSQASSEAADPVSLISSLIDAEKVTPDSKPAEAAQPETETEYQPEENAQVEGEEPKGEVAEIPLDQLEAIELETTYKGDDGKDVTQKLSIKELREGYMRDKDYRVKTTALARQRDEVSQSTRQGIEAERTQYVQNLQLLQTALLETVAPELKNVDWNDLSVNNPLEHIRLKQRQEQVGNVLRALQTKQQEALTQSQASARQVQVDTAKKTWESLTTDIPGWSDETYKKSLKAAEPLGYTEAEVGAWLDPRAIKLLNKARLYDELQAGKPAADKKVVAVPKVIKPGATSVKTTKQDGALDRLRKSGKISDLAAFLS